MTAHQLKVAIEEFLEQNILSKAEEDMTEKDRVVLSSGRAFGDVLVRYNRQKVSISEREYAKVSSSFSAVHNLEPAGDD